MRICLRSVQHTGRAKNVNSGTLPLQARTWPQSQRMRRCAVEDQAIRAALERHWSDINDQDLVHEIYHDDVVLEFPQGGERLVGRANVRAMRDAYPSGPALRTERIRGSGDLWVAEN